MKVLSILLIILFVITLLVAEMSKMLKNKLYRELLLFLIFLFSGAVAGIMISAGKGISNPSDWIAFIYSPFLGLMKYILK